MGEFKDQADLKLAMNGRMTLLTGGMILIFIAVTTSFMYGFNMFSVASEAAKGNEEYVKALSELNLSGTILYVTAVCFFLIAILEVAAGIYYVLRCNRLDKASLSLRIAVALLAAEIVMQAFLFIVRLMNVSSVLLALAIPLYLIWGSSRMIKLAKLYPDRILALNMKGRRDAAARKAAPAPPKSLRERAMMNTYAQDADEDVDASEHIHTAQNETSDNTDMAQDAEQHPGESETAEDLQKSESIHI